MTKSGQDGSPNSCGFLWGIFPISLRAAAISLDAAFGSSQRSFRVEAQDLLSSFSHTQPQLEEGCGQSSRTDVMPHEIFLISENTKHVKSNFASYL